MFKVKTAALAIVLGVGMTSAALAQVVPGIAGSPGRGNSSSVSIMPNGGIVSNGYLAEPDRTISTDNLTTGTILEAPAIVTTPAPLLPLR